MMAPTSAMTFPEGIMNVHDATCACSACMRCDCAPQRATCRFRLDLDRPWSLDEYIEGPITDSVNIVAWALDKVIRECLGDPLSPRVLTQTLEKNVWNSTLTLSAALDSAPLHVVFDERAHRALPMALGNLVNGAWKVAGVYDPAVMKFTERSEVIQWPKTKKLAPRSWLSCKQGERLTALAGQLQQCEPCGEGTFSAGGQSTVCVGCMPGASERPSGEHCGCRAAIPQISEYGQATSSPNARSSAASTARFSATSIKICTPKRRVRPAPTTRGDTATFPAQLIAARANARKVRLRTNAASARRCACTALIDSKGAQSCRLP